MSGNLSQSVSAEAGAPVSGRPPLSAAVEEYLKKNRSRLHMPGHKGAAAYPVGEAARFDITEVEGADSLYEAAGAIAKTEQRYSRLYGTACTFLSAGGSTLCIQAMLALACPPGARVIAARGVHAAAVNAMALLDLRPAWVWPRGGGEAGWMQPVTAGQVEETLAAHPDAAAVYLTSPNYLGLLSDIAAISAVCRKAGIPLLVDNAHGAHLKFLEPALHPMELGADLCCDSLHKTLPVLTGGALLHLAAPCDRALAKARMALFGSTSPSYLILLSMDGALPYLEESAGKDLKRTAGWVQGWEELAAERGFALPEGVRDPARLALGFARAGYSREAFGRYVRSQGIEPEYLGGRFAVFLPGGANSGEDLERMERMIREFHPVGKDLPRENWGERNPMAALSLREAVFSPMETVPVEKAAGRIAGGMVAPCPPGIPLAVPGERIGGELAGFLKSAGILQVNVVK